jgi:ketosteroid isomerase-like protein
MSTAATSLADVTEPIAAVRFYMDSFNKSDVEGMAAVCEDPMTILDGMAPHVWHGPTAAADWFGDAMTEGEHLGAADYFVELGEAKHNQVTGDSAYVVFATTMTFKLKGTPITQSGAFFTAALRKNNDGWRLASWAWTKGSAQPG